jgi:hypothetical protein
MDQKPSLEELKQFYDLKPIPVEGGLYHQVYRSDSEIPGKLCAPGVNADVSHPVGTSILFLLSNAPDSFSAIHRLPKDEIYHFYFGDPVELLLLYPDGTSQVIILGQDVLHGQKVQFVVPAGVWQGSHLKPDLSTEEMGYALMGATMAPGFHVSDFEGGERDELMLEYPDQNALIKALTRVGVGTSRS